MKKFNQISTFVLAVVFVFGLAGSNTAHAALATGFLGTADTYSVWGAAGITGGAPPADVWGNAGENGTSDGSLSGQQAGTYHFEDQSATVGVDITSAYGDLAGETQTGIGVLDLDIPNTVGPGVYDVGTTATWSAALTLNGAGTYIFRGADSIAQTAGGTMILTGACASDVYWRAGTAMTFAAAGNIEGTIITHTGITFANSALTLKGRALAEGGSVTLGGITITEPTCSSGGTPPVTPPGTPPPGTLPATLHVVKNVENDDGDDQHADDFTLYVKLAGTNVAGSPALGVKSPGRTYSLAAGTYVVSEDEDSAYNQSFSGGCDSDGNVTLIAGDNKTCTITNDDKKDTDKSEKHKKAAPKLPAAGIGPQENNTPWNIVIPVGILMLVSTSLVIVKRKRTI